ncbi:histidinol-phosphate transaminase [Orrella marina]|uniref:Histidinol-phosphate aminotransferase n=1 Tax=Orrella marina TaxID=2163011 RepID=A0A2R4XI71_9BURK|nr:histidinol-phosphate transaminase [Orrella marina]AWB33500.1 histidinol-phosphate transaminase [Orrella marina]
MSRFWSRSVSSLDPYVPGEQPLVHNLIKLNTNEHPLGPSPRVLEAIAQASTASLRLYPDPNATALTQAIARRYGLAAANVFLGNGSDEVLAHVFYGLLKQDRPLFLPDLTYGFYPTYCRLYGIDYHFVPLDEQFQIRAEDYFPGQAEVQAGAIIIANPNAPTGHALNLGQIKDILSGNPDIPVVVDEAYVDFGAQSAVSLISDHPNLLVVHTFSKSRSLAGLRVGYAMGSAELIDGLERVKNSFNSYPLDSLAQAGALAAIEDDAYFEAACRQVIETRESLRQSLRELGFEVLPSSTNFLLARHPDHKGEDLAAWLRERAILVRHFNKPRIRDFLRITVGTPEQCRCLIEALIACVKP